MTEKKLILGIYKEMYAVLENVAKLPYSGTQQMMNQLQLFMDDSQRLVDEEMADKVREKNIVDILDYIKPIDNKDRTTAKTLDAYANSKIVELLEELAIKVSSVNSQKRSEAVFNTLRYYRKLKK